MAAVALAVGLVLADASVVILALPAIYREYNAEVADVAWVVTAFNLAIALAAVPAARLATRRPAGQVCAGGLAVFAAGAVACALAPSLAVLIGARAVQGVGGAAAVCAALGPAIGGLLTQLISWQSIFVAQVPLALMGALVVFRHAAPVVAARAGRPHLAANIALGLLSAGLAAVLFLLVLLLVEGWRMPPISAALVVTVMPAAALLAAPFERRIADTRTRAAAGTLLGTGGVAALGLLPGADWAWTLAPQLLVGAGLALSLGALTEAAIAGRSAAAIHGGVTIAARHAGVVLGLVLLTPVFAADLDRQRERATQKGAELVLDARVDALTKVELASRIASDIRRRPGRLPDIHHAFAAVDASERERPQLRVLERQLNEQLDRAATSSFERSFLFAAALAALALIPIALTRRVTL